MNEQDIRTSDSAPYVLSLFVLLLDTILLGAIVWITTIVRWRFEAIFTDFGVNLPIVTMLILSVPGKVYAMLTAGLAIILLAKELMIVDARRKLRINIVAGVALLAFAALFSLAMLLPWMSLFEIQNAQ
jgi:hypothetical protein